MIEELANAKQDFLTGCYAKETLSPLFIRLMADYKLQKKPFSILLLDVDHFKSFNDKYGHLHGDEVLKYFSSSLRLALSEEECVIIRFGGDEFVVVFIAKDSRGVSNIAAMLQKTIRSRLFLLKGRLLRMSFSGGIVSYPIDGEEMDVLLAKADEAMYFSKKLSRARTIPYRKIGLEKFKRLAVRLSLACILIFGALSSAGLFKNYFPKAFEYIKSLRVTFTLPTHPLREQKLYTVYLKSGGVFRGVLVKEKGGEIDIKLRSQPGQGVITINRADIKVIEPYKKAESASN